MQIQVFIGCSQYMNIPSQETLNRATWRCGGQTVAKMKAYSKVGFAVLISFAAWLILELVPFGSDVPTLEEFVRSHGYPWESHDVVTEDGYIVTLFRIPHGKSLSNGHRHPVLLQHGVMSSSTHFVMLGPNSSLAFLLAERGYDVWLGNSRGSTYSLKHVSKNISDSTYWDFSWHEMGLYDLPAVIDYILNNTNKEQLSYIGYSMGGTMLGVLQHFKPEYSSKINVFIGVAPAISIEHTNSTLMTFFCYYYAPFAQKMIGEGNWLPWRDTFSGILVKICKPNSWFFSYCIGAYNNLGKSTQARTEDLSWLNHYLLSSTSLKTLSHFGQQVQYGIFQAYVHSPEENKRRYGTEIPPVYDIRKMTMPSVLIYSDNDYVVHGYGVEKVSKTLPNATAIRVKLSTFNHFDFLFGKDAFELVYKDVFRILDDMRI